MEIVSGTGRTIDRRNSAFLCRCGASANKPFCDGSHSKVSFTDRYQPDAGVDQSHNGCTSAVNGGCSGDPCRRKSSPGGQGMLVVETVTRIRREHFVKGKTIKEIRKPATAKPQGVNFGRRSTSSGSKLHAQLRGRKPPPLLKGILPAWPNRLVGNRRSSGAAVQSRCLGKFCRVGAKSARRRSPPSR